MLPKLQLLKAQICAAFVAGAMVSMAGALWAAASQEYLVSQAGRKFTPGELVINRAETIQILNDDGDLLHHVFIESRQMNFDSGDQTPGSRTPITFPIAGDFTVLCAIHPKMKLFVHVR
jgi:plastocyanin